jgi:hypothetical protein
MVARMTGKLLVISITIAIVCLAWASALNRGLGVQVTEGTSNFEASYNLSGHTLYMSFPLSVTDYYVRQSHDVNQMGYPRFVTPGALRSVAENIRKTTHHASYNDEEFANAVMAFVRQITYLKSNAKYPVETLRDNQADCDGLSILAASILKAGGLDVVLLLYNNINPSHMNVGIHLEKMPVSNPWWTKPSGVEYDNKTYWMAECTSLAEWRVGERPSLLDNTEPLVIPLTNCELDSPAQVSSSLDSPLQPSAISINLATAYFNASNGALVVNVSGSILPALPNEPVVLYVNQPGYVPTVSKATTDQFGNYAWSWNVTWPGTYVISTNWRGSFDHSGSDSNAITVFIGAQQPVIEELSDSIWDRQVNYVSWGQYSSSYMALFNQGSKEFLKRDLNGTQIVLSGDFTILSDGHEIAPQDTVFTMPPHSIYYRGQGSNQTLTVKVPEKEATIPGAELLNSYFAFILQRKQVNNYTASVKTLKEEDLSQINQKIDEGTALFINASNVMEKEIWCKAIVKVSEEEVVVEVCNENGTQLGKISRSRCSQELSELGVLITYQTGQIIAFKNLNVEFLNRSIPLITEEVDEQNGFDLSYLHAIASLLFVGAILVLVIFWQKKRRTTTQAR